MEFQRDIYERLIQWKTDRTGRVLEISGARQVGKTFILQKFAREQFDAFVYINMAENSGERFCRCLDKAEDWEPGMPAGEEYVHEAVKLFAPDFEDTEDTVIVIDEIQESSRVYNLIRTFARTFSAYVVVTRSYLGRLLEKDFFLPAGDVDAMTMGPLTFAEFAGVFDLRQLYHTVDLFGGSQEMEYGQLRECFALYQRIGGYPSVVRTYLIYRDEERCRGELGRLMDIFVHESKRYLTNVMEVNAFEKLFHGIAVTLLREKQGTEDLVEELSSIVYKQESGRFTKKMIHNAIGWLQASHIIAYAGKCIDCNYLDVKENARFYFQDLGVASLFLTRAGADEADIKGILAEDFVFLSLLRRVSVDVAGTAPWSGTYEKTGGELDFFVRSMKDHKNYGIEVKSGGSGARGRTARALFDAHKLDYVYLLKGGSDGGRTESGRMMTVPLFLADRISFSLGTESKGAGERI
ncbi:MAG: ATP-binding protein [Lachnospiraceae bacterium]|nr:ATP-binding protein [Lachnospiraceae bacterium]